MAYAIKKGSDYFNTKVWEGNSTADRNISGVGFSPDFLWIKNRTVARYHRLQDTVRGINASSPVLYSDLTDAEATSSAGVTAVDSDGFTIQAGNGWNATGENYVGWLWRGSDSAAVSNTDGTITSQVSANPTSGFSVVSYTGNGTGGSTVGHGLDSTPKMIIIKNRSTTSDWLVYHTSYGATKFTKLNDTTAATSSGNFMSNTEPTSSVFSIGTFTAVNNSGSDHIAYCFAEVPGFSKMGSYTGNGSSDGPFVYTGFKPAFVLVKDTSTAKSWMIQDSARDTYNVAQYGLSPDLSDAEAVAGRWDMVSNGFKLRTSGSFINGSADNYIYMAFAECPFKYANGR